MPETVDVYSDQFGLNVGPYGCTMNFQVSSPNPPPPNVVPQPQTVANIRMSLQHLKVMTFILRQQVIQYERQTGVDIQIPQDVLNSLHISREDWQSLWNRPL